VNGNGSLARRAPAGAVTLKAISSKAQRDGVFKNWAVPMGLPEEPGVQRLAVQVEDRPPEFGDFEGTIPEGEYGGGEVSVWDRGTCTIVEWADSAVRFRLTGARLSGDYLLLRFQRKGPREWPLRMVS